MIIVDRCRCNEASGRPLARAQSLPYAAPGGKKPKPTCVLTLVVGQPSPCLRVRQLFHPGQYRYSAIPSTRTTALFALADVFCGRPGIRHNGGQILRGFPRHTSCQTEHVMVAGAVLALLNPCVSPDAIFKGICHVYFVTKSSIVRVLRGAAWTAPTLPLLSGKRTNSTLLPLAAERLAETHFGVAHRKTPGTGPGVCFDRWLGRLDQAAISFVSAASRPLSWPFQAGLLRWR